MIAMKTNEKEENIETTVLTTQTDIDKDRDRTRPFTKPL